MFDLSQQSIDDLRVSRAKATETFDKSTGLPQLQAAFEIARVDLELERRRRADLELCVKQLARSVTQLAGG